MGKQRIRVGDVFQIPLSNGRMAYGQYVFRDIGCSRFSEDMTEGVHGS